MHMSISMFYWVSLTTPFDKLLFIPLDSHFEHYPDDYPKAENDLVVGFGLGQLASAAVACSITVVDLIDPAVEAVRLAFRVGGVVQQSCLPFRDSSEADASWSVIVPGTAEEIEKELLSSQTQLVHLDPKA